AFTAHAVLSDLNPGGQVRRGKLETAREQQALQLRQDAMTWQEQQVRSLLDQLQVQVGQATAAARRAGIEVRSLQATARAIARAKAREARRGALLSQGPG